MASFRVPALVQLAAGVVILGGLKYAEDFFAPILLGFLIAAISSPLVLGVTRRGMPPLAGALLALLLDMGVLGVMGALMVLASSDLQRRLPFYFQRLSALEDAIAHTMGRHHTGAVTSEHMTDALGNLAGQFASGATRTSIALLVAFFTLWELASLTRKFRAFTADDPEPFERLESIVEQIRRYLVVKAWTSFLAGVLIYGVLKALSVGPALLLAMMLFLLHFIPNVGAVIAAVPAVIIALAERGPTVALGVGVAYLVTNTVVGGVMEPRMLGRKLGLSALVVLLSMLFWGWLWGPFGALLAVPLMVVTKIILEHIPRTIWVARWLEASPDLPPFSRRRVVVPDNLPRPAPAAAAASIRPQPTPPTPGVVPPRYT